jgi:hypothetical protein
MVAGSADSVVRKLKWSSTQSKRHLALIVRHSVLAIEEPLLLVDLHQPCDVDLGGILKRTEGELPILLPPEVDHQLIHEVALARGRVARDHRHLPRHDGVDLIQMRVARAGPAASSFKP